MLIIAVVFYVNKTFVVRSANDRIRLLDFAD